MGRNGQSHTQLKKPGMERECCRFSLTVGSKTIERLGAGSGGCRGLGVGGMR